ncbi:MAG: AMP-binding protein [Limnoraphis robusta]|uniref:AMP-binding protein n=1 Tax=Limnoraphis robusta CCNP1315 TaxID=3110306 RepID=A0ABU5TRU3_9CYAN|nr:AMP-binding protein [Limnoraphis robusta]MEA5496813.1 AMP-binding protein [Limnoraphis robusta BA-68 BA1]MEA5517601.1 AMP-binding protein [Limnoraphis robusta CCNP1315]MEA5544597.1 AMP-binding protein [Limnoraphis robusta CCNP1324]
MNKSSSSDLNYTSIQSLPEIWPILAKKVGQGIALHDPHSQPEVILSYSELWLQIQQFAAGLQTLGVEAVSEDALPSRIALFADDSPRWMIADQGIMTVGAADVVRGATADPAELVYILKDSGSVGLVVEDLNLLKRLRSSIEDLPIKFIVLLSDEEPDPSEIPSIPVLNFSQLLNKGGDFTLRIPRISGQDSLATLLYTSGTTGKPKGVMLTHGNLLHQLKAIPDFLQPEVGDCVLSLLPTWHSFGRTGQYFFLSQGCTQVYSSIRYFKRDLKEFKPRYMTSVPRIWESIYEAAQKQLSEQPASRQKIAKFCFNVSERYVLARRRVNGLTLDAKSPSGMEKASARLQMGLLTPLHRLADRLVYQKIRAATGGEFKFAISGGGSLAMHLEMFYEIVGVDLLVGYGLTETSPVLTARRPLHNLRGSAGKPIPQTEIRIVDPETRQVLPRQEKGVVLARGPQIMKGYFENPEATAKAIDPEGWFDTGDLGWLSRQNDLVLTGRAKDTIVLSNGENIEPQPIEDACIRSPYIDQMVLVGQDQKVLGALIVPNFDALEKWANSQNLKLKLPNSESVNDNEALDLESPPVQDLFRKELNREVKNRPSYRIDDRIGPFRLILEPFTMENGMLTQTLKIKRPVVMERYRDMIDAMY